MTPQRQTLFGAPRGDCFRAALASLLDLPLASVPNFVEAAYWWQELEAWLGARGYDPMRLPWPPPTGVTWQPGGYYLASGESPRDHALRHAVVYLDGRLAHDPHPDGTGLAGEPDAVILLIPRHGGRT